jgi:hypothetical protein
MDALPAMAPPRRDGTMPGLTTRFSYEPYPLRLEAGPGRLYGSSGQASRQNGTSPTPPSWGRAECPDRHGSRPVSPPTLISVKTHSASCRKCAGSDAEAGRFCFPRESAVSATGLDMAACTKLEAPERDFDVLESRSR